MPLPNLQDLEISELQQVIENARKLIAQKEQQKRDKAIAEARAILEKAGVDPRALGKLGGRKRAAVPLKQGDRYVNPDNSSQSWTVGKGRRPKWLSQLEAKGRMPEPQ